ncbi:MAG: hypothetical protein JNL36_03055 [Candidatus Kapabacteria bacterium]|nr:hypothetical protein [Candidatus Kapabacteria bacterium]
MKQILNLIYFVIIFLIPFSLFSKGWENFAENSSIIKTIDTVLVTNKKSLTKLEKYLKSVDTIRYLNVTCKNCTDEIAFLLNNTKTYIQYANISVNSELNKFPIQNLNIQELRISCSLFYYFHLSDLPNSIEELILTSSDQVKILRTCGVEIVSNNRFVDDGDFTNLKDIVIQGTILTNKKGDFPQSFKKSFHIIEEILFDQFDCKIFTIFPNTFLEMPKVRYIAHGYDCYNKYSLVRKYHKFFIERNIEMAF